MKSRKSLVIAIISLLILGAIIINLNPIIKALYVGSYQRTLYNDNSKIIAEGDSYSFLNKTGINENNETNLEFRFTGMDTIWELDASKDTVIKIDYKSEILEGKFKVVLIEPTDKIINIIEQSATGNKEISIIKGKSRIKMVGDDAKGKLQWTMLSSNDVNITPINH